jgi:prepilin-type N-terminal cleavage/methylation domain-containing protein
MPGKYESKRSRSGGDKLTPFHAARIISLPGRCRALFYLISPAVEYPSLGSSRFKLVDCASPRGALFERGAISLRMSAGPAHGPACPRRGFTLVEVIVVLLLLGLAAAFAAPVFLAPDRNESGLVTVVRGARQLAERRGENLHLDMGPDGRWSVTGAASLEEGTLAEGELADYDGPRFRLVLSPIGTCALDVRSLRVTSTVQVDPLTCEIDRP